LIILDNVNYLHVSILSIIMIFSFYLYLTIDT